MKSIILTGMMGSGKTTCGRRIARKLGRAFVDTDEQIVSRAGRSIPEIFASDGEAAFRDLETAVCRSLEGQEDLVIATGGGLVLRPENVASLKRSGVVVFLDRPPEAIFASTSMAGRPLAQGGREAFLETFARREATYRNTADLTVRAAGTVEETVRNLLRRLSEWEGVI